MNASVGERKLYVVYENGEQHELFSTQNIDIMPSKYDDDYKSLLQMPSITLSVKIKAPRYRRISKKKKSKVNPTKWFLKRLFKGR